MHAAVCAEGLHLQEPHCAPPGTFLKQVTLMLFALRQEAEKTFKF